MCMDFEQKVKKDIKDQVLTVDEKETYYRARAMRQGVEELRTLSKQNEPLNSDQARKRNDVEKLLKNAKDIRFDYDESRFNLDEVAEAAAFLTKAKEYGYSSELDVTDNPILYKEVADGKEGTKLEKRGYFEKKSIKKSAKKFRKKYKELYEARVSEEIEKYKDKDVYDIGADVSYNAQVKFTKEDIDKIRNRDVLKVNLNDPVSRFVLGLPAEKKDRIKEEAEKQRIDRLYEDFGELQGLMNTGLFKKYLIMNPSVLNSYASKSVFVPGLFAGLADFYTLTENYSRWMQDPETYGFVKSDDIGANGGINTARLKELGTLIKTVLSLSSMSRQAQEYKSFINSLLDNGDAYGITEGETKESVKPHNRSSAEKADNITKELATRYGGAMRMLMDMHKDILRHTAYLGADSKKKNNIESLPSFHDYFGKRTEYAKFDE